MKRTLIPNDFRDFLSIISIIGMLAIFFKFTIAWGWLDENLTAFFLVVIGFALVVAGNLFTIGRWAKDGIQGGEIVKILTIVIGGFSIVIGALLLASINVPTSLTGIVGLVGITSAIFIFVDYVAKNK